MLKVVHVFLHPNPNWKLVLQKKNEVCLHSESSESSLLGWDRNLRSVQCNGTRLLCQEKDFKFDSGLIVLIKAFSSTVWCLICELWSYLCNSVGEAAPYHCSHHTLFWVTVFSGKVKNRICLWKTRWHHIEIGFWPCTHRQLSESIREYHNLLSLGIPVCLIINFPKRLPRQVWRYLNFLIEFLTDGLINVLGECHAISGNDHFSFQHLRLLSMWMVS